MPRLDFYFQQKRIVTIKLNEASILIGRGSESDVQLPSETVSRQHARILVGGAGDHRVEDLSTNGTRLNDQFMDRPKLLTPGDRIYIEDYTIIYQGDDTPPEKLEASDQTVLGMRAPKFD